MSWREFKFGQTVRLKDRKDTRLGVVIARTLDNAKAIVAFDGIRGEWTYPDDALEPSAQPHVAAGSGFKERLEDAMIEWAFAVQKSYRDDASPRDILERRDAIDALIAEVCELPEPTEYKAVKMNNGLIGIADLGLFLEREEALQLAAALIRAATSGRDAS